MSGPKAYTMKEMKGIVEYLVEQKAYSEFRGRKMWVDFAKSSRTKRTWQSLKETFLKRILPDVQNPYYHLTREQVCSFKQGTDVEAKERKRLEIQPVNENSSNNENQKEIEEPSTSAEKRNETENTLGEKVKSATITARNRSSADTFILDNPEVSKKTTEDLLAELEEPATSMKDCLNFEYSEPPSVVRKVLEDFQTDSEGSDKEPQMEIVEDTTENDNTDDIISIQEVIVVEDSENLDNVEYIEEEKIITEGGMEVDIGPTFDHEIITEVSSPEFQGFDNWVSPGEQEVQEIPAESNESSGEIEETTVEPHGDTDNDESQDLRDLIVIEDSENQTETTKEKENMKSLDNNINNQNSLSTTTDTIIPNNQEVMDTQNQISNPKLDILAPLQDAASRKRSTSQDQTLSKKKKLDNETEKTNGDAIEITPPGSNNTEALFEALKNADNPIDDGKQQDAQDIDESPQNKNLCLKSVSLFDEQFNTTKYSDSEEETPIPNNGEKINDNTISTEYNQETAKDLPSSDKKNNAVNIDLPAEKKKEKHDANEKQQEKTEKVDPPVEKSDKPKENDRPAEKKHEEAAKADPSVENKQEKTVNIDPAVEKKQDNNAKIDPSTEKKLEKPVKLDLPVEKKQENAVKVDQSSEKKQEKPVKVDLKFEKIREKPVKVDLLFGKKQDVIVLKSNSDSDEQRTLLALRPKERFKHLAQAFGFVPGTSVTATQRRRSLRSRNRTKSQRNSCTLQEASDWEGSISEPELADEYISPPRCQRNRHARRYRKPQSGRIMSLEEDGALFVVHGAKVIPLVKNGKNLTFVTYNNSGLSEDEEESMWRQKYIDEKKKAAELKRQLEEAKEATTSRSKSPILQNPSRSIPSTSAANLQNPLDIDISKQMHIKQTGDAGKIQITLSKNNEESINLEGRWPQVLPIVQQVMSMFYKEDNAATVAGKPDDKTIDISGMETPIIPTINLATSNVDELESVIFKEIEEQDKKEKTTDTNVTKRKAGRPKKIASIGSEPSEKAAKRSRKSKQTEPKDIPETTAQAEDANKPETKPQSDNEMADIKPAENIVKTAKKLSIVISSTDRLSVESALSNTSSKQTPPAKVKAAKQVTEAKDKLAATDDTDNESVKIVTTEPVEPRVTRARKSGNETDTSSRTTRQSLKKMLNEDEDRYMLPPEPKKQSNNNRASRKTALRSPEPHEASQVMFGNSIDSTHGYQDSDSSPENLATMRRKRKVSFTVRKGKHIPRRKSFPSLASVPDMSLDSSNSSYFVPKKPKLQITLDSAIYKSESYEILIGNRKFEKLDENDESSKSYDLEHFVTAISKSTDNPNNIIELGSSSNVSLPLSPELSVVENLSISREMIRSDTHPTINETQANDSVVNNIYNQYLISEVDVSVPLMQQNCELLNTPANKAKKHKSPIKVSEFLNKVCTVNMSVNNTLSDSLDRKLRDLLLESAKKISETNKENLMDVDESKVESNKTKGKKRCSTPRKRGTKKLKTVIGPVIDEHMESCSLGGRRSCPPAITFISIDENANNSADVQLKVNPKPARVKKDIIKVKIQRPKKKGAKELPEITVNTSQISVYTDSGINDTASNSGVFLQSSDSVELIHNHSETCLQANECIENSIEFIENSRSESVISISSTVSLESELLKVMGDVDLLSGEYNTVKTQNASVEKSSGEIFGTPTNSVYHSPIASNSSLVTDDLSQDAPIPPTKWYLLSEDDTNNTNMRPEQMTSNSRVSNFASLKKLFPITCAVPDLSTISEMSKDNEGSRRGFDTEGDGSSDYQSLM